MRANEFVKKFGWSEATHVVSQAPKSDCSYSLDLKIYLDRYAFSKHEVYIDDLKRLVESWELVEKLGGLESAKDEYFSCVQNNEPASYVAKAIAGVESCQ